MSDLVTITKSDGVADVRLNRPDKYNALSGEMFEAIIEAGESLRDAKDVRVIVLSGNGRGFCAGLDFSSFQGMAGTPNARRAPAPERCFSALPTNRKSCAAARDDLEALAVPVIAAVHGVAYGGGCQIALGADIRIASPDAKLSVMEIKWGSSRTCL